MEILAVAKLSAAQEIKARLDAHKVPAPVSEFLVQQWLKLLLLLHVKEGKESASWKGAVEAMDQLIWSIEAKGTREERGKLVAVIPGLLRKLAVGMKAGIDGYTRSLFFAELMKYHKQAITGPVEGNAESAPAEGHAVQQAAAAGEADASGSLDLSAPVTVMNPFGEGEVNVESLDLDFTALDPGAPRARRDAAPASPLSGLVVGTWVEFREKGDQPSRRPAKLIFVTPRKTRYLFAFDRAGKDITPYSPSELARLFRRGESIIVDEPRAESLFDRIMKGLVGKLRAPAVAR
jgi:hypothetical protein